MSGSYKVCDTERKRSFQTNDSTWCFGDRLLFFFFAVWSMVGSNEIDGSVCKSPDDCLAIFFGTEWRIHFGKGAVFKDGIFCQSKMMWCGFCVKVCPHFPVGTDQIDRDTGTDMLDHNIGTGFECQQAVSCNQRFFSNRRRTVDAEGI